MVARIQPQTGLHVTFERDGREHDAAIAPTAESALYIGIRMLSRLDDLRAGDRLTVEETK
jgi:hypothetical protein